MNKPDIGLRAYFSVINCVLIIFIEQLVIGVAEYNDLSSASVCKNPNERIGSCISIRDCKPLFRVLQDEYRPAYGFLRQSQCFRGIGRPPLVCCTSDTNFRDNSDRIIFPDECTTTSESSIETSIFPRPPHCGLITIGQRIYGGEEAKLTEFSWMVNLEYRSKNGEKTIACAGSLINKRYVLTAAHCVKGKIERDIGKLESVRIGEHNTETDLDCNEYGCLDPAIRCNIEEGLVHEEFHDIQKSRDAFHHDIALLRLDRDIKFNDALQPVCLPIDMDLQKFHAGTMFTVAGWGHNGTVSSTAEKRKLNLPLVEKSACRKSFARYIDVFDEQLCAGGVFRKDTCNGDSGGPLMYLYNGVWYIEGLVSFGIGCGVERPTIYTNVRSYLQWIKDNIK